MTRDELRAKANELPLLPGVYLMMDKTGQVIYVGKAKKLKNRVSQYFQDTASHNEKTKMMVSHVDRFDTIIVRSEFEALVLENSLIKRHQPRYNILLKDDKGYPFVRLSAEAYPRFSLVNRPADDGAKYFGPFGGRHETRLALDAVCTALRLPTCNRRFPRDIGRERPCLNFHMGRCDGFCRPDGPDSEEYRRRMAQATALLDGRLRAVTAELTEKMTAAAESLDFETAAACRDRLRALSVLTKDQNVIAGICADTDVWGAYTSPARSGCAILHIEGGDLLGRQTEVFPTAADSDGALLSAVVPQYYLSRSVLPREILLPAPLEDADALSALLTERAGYAVTLRVPQRGQRRALLDIAHRNAREEVERVTDAAQRINGTLRLLQETAQLPALPRRMESYDISHTGGSDQVGGMVVFQDGKPLRSAYRRFRIESCQGADDYGAMREVLTRRFRRYLEGDEKFAPLPELLLMDGGQEHARVAEQVLAECGLDVPVLGMVKDDRHRTRALVTARGQELGIRQNPALFALIGTVQEEVHRFAIAYHHQRHVKSAKRSQLDNVPGIGEARKKRLLQHFGTVAAVKAATVEQLSAVVPRAAAQALYAKLHP